MKQKFLQRSLSVFMSMRQRRPFDSYTKNIHFFAFIFNRYSKNIRLHLCARMYFYSACVDNLILSF